jgi:hypothetical protein
MHNGPHLTDPTLAYVSFDLNDTQSADFFGPLHNNLADVSAAAHGCNLFSSTNGMTLPEQDQPAREFHATYLGGEFNGEPHDVGFFEGPQPEFLGAEVIEPITLAPENAASVQEQGLVDTYVPRLLSC